LREVTAAATALPQVGAGRAPAAFPAPAPGLRGLGDFTEPARIRLPAAAHARTGPNQRLRVSVIAGRYARDYGLDMVDERSSAMADQQPQADADDEPIRFASVVTVKRTKSVSPFADGAYGTTGILALSDANLIFVRRGAVDWRIPRDAITSVKKPWYGIGTYVTFEVDGAFYGLAFNQRSTDNLASVGQLGVASGGVAGVGVGIAADALAASRLHGSVKLGSRWFELLRSRAR
jgi:hypothetical protein